MMSASGINGAKGRMNMYDIIRVFLATHFELIVYQESHGPYPNSECRFSREITEFLGAFTSMFLVGPRTSCVVNPNDNIADHNENDIIIKETNT